VCAIFNVVVVVGVGIVVVVRVRVVSETVVRVEELKVGL